MAQHYWNDILPNLSDDSQWSNASTTNQTQQTLATSSLEMENVVIEPQRKKIKRFPATSIMYKSWDDICCAYQSLLQEKSSISGRRFNKKALELLDACIHLARQNNAGQMPSSNTAATEWNFEQENLSKFRAILLNDKELASEDLVHQIVQWVNKGLPVYMTADERKDTLLKKSLAFVQELSPALSIKTGPMIKSCVAQMFDAQLDNLFAEVQMPDLTVKEKSIMYRRMLGNFLDDAKCVSFACTNKQLLGRLQPKDLYFLTFFACVTVRRSRSDRLLQLGCVGTSSVGKSVLFENVILSTAHQLLSSASSGSGDSGVGRMSCGAKNAVVFHDINIATLLGVDVEKVKSMARGENTIAKVHSSTVAVSPVFLFYSSNERLFRHVIPAQFSGTGLQVTKSSQAEMLLDKKKISQENLEAIRARFLEMYAFKAPQQSRQDLETCGTFTRENFILGTFDRALELLEHYGPNDFHTAHLPAYIISSLTKNLSWMESVMCVSSEDETKMCPYRHSERIEKLKLKYNYLI